MKDLELAPDPNLMESMRAVGYTMETAVADILDNSVSARATSVDIAFGPVPEPHIAIADNGEGMDEVGLIEAMRLAGRSPTAQRDEHDLGRFGLGLKTASLSQCRCLTVISKQNGACHGVRWDLNHLISTGAWALQVLSESELAGVPGFPRLADRDTGTLVVWTDLDRVAERSEDMEQQLDERMARTREHLSLVFHRFTTQATPPLEDALTITINGSPLPEVDPFLTKHRGTSEGPRETFRVRDAVVTVKPFTLPYLNKLKARDRDMAMISGSLRDTQGFYIYRANRLVQWGTWFRLTPKSDMNKLARVQVDIPNTLDDLWSLDIKKSAAIPPAEVRKQLRRLAAQIIQPSQRVQRFRGRPIDPQDEVRRLWTLIDDRSAFRYEINLEHPLVRALSDQLPQREQRELLELITALQSTFPVEDAYNRLAEDLRHEPRSVEPDQVVELARAMQASMGCDVTTLTQRLALVEPFTQVPELETFLRGALDDTRR